MQASLGQSGGELGVGDGWGCPQETDVECRLVFRELPLTGVTGLRENPARKTTWFWKNVCRACSEREMSPCSSSGNSPPRKLGGSGEACQRRRAVR